MSKLFAAIVLTLLLCVLIVMGMHTAFSQEISGDVSLCLKVEDSFELAEADKRGGNEMNALWEKKVSEGKCGTVRVRLEIVEVLMKYTADDGENYVASVEIRRGDKVVRGFVIFNGWPLPLNKVRDDGRYAQSPLKSWFDSLKSKKGFCCSVTDGEETEYDIRGDSYWAPIDGVWKPVPPDAVLKEPNRLGRPMKWLYNPTGKGKEFRCFLPGGGV